MLTDLTIKNIAIIDKLHISFKDGLTVLTGETGAGKSIIIDAVGLIMGGRASSELIRSGEEEAVVEALFDISGQPEIRKELADSGFESEDELLIKRSISRSGKNRIFINGAMATLAILSELTPQLINIYGQHESQTLLKPENHLRLLDSFAKLAAERETFTKLFSEISTIKGELLHFDETERDAERKLDLLLYQTDEIAAANLQAGEEEELAERRRILSSAEKLGHATAEAFEQLYEGDGAILGQVRRIKNSIADIATIDQRLGDLAAILESACLQLEDASGTLRDYASKVELNPTMLQQTEDRLDQLYRLKKKYAPTVIEILQFKERLDQEIEEIKGRDENLNELKEKYGKLNAELLKQGAKLSAKRKASAVLLAQALEHEIHQLAMKNAIIEVAIQPLAEPRIYGYEKVEFLFSPNPGEIPRPLVKIASGGELSRLMLAFKQILPESDVATLIFDEVDTGIGGATSEMVGKKLKNVAATQQVLCITHLPQVAAFAKNHLRVEKQISDGRTKTEIKELTSSTRKDEIARMLAGSKVTESALAHAAEMLAESY